MMLHSDMTVGIGSGDIPGDDLKVFPNPADDFVHLIIPGKESSGVLSIMDMSGREVLQQACDHKETGLDVSSLSEGIYLIHFQGPRNFKQSRLAICRE